MNKDVALSRAKKTLTASKSGAVVPVNRSGRNDLIARAQAASQRTAVNSVEPAKAVALVEQPKGGALIAKMKEAAAKPVPVRPVVKIPDPPKVETPAPVKAPASVPATQIVPVEIAPGQTMPVPVEVPPVNAGGAQQPIVVNVNVVNENRGWWGPYWYADCPRWTCPHRRGLPCNRFWCW